MHVRINCVFIIVKMTYLNSLLKFGLAVKGDYTNVKRCFVTMLYPSIDEMMNKVDSKYSLVVAASRRARQLREGEKSDLRNAKSNKQVGVALEEIYGDLLVVIKGQDEEEEE